MDNVNNDNLDQHGQCQYRQLTSTNIDMVNIDNFSVDNVSIDQGNNCCEVFPPRTPPETGESECVVGWGGLIVQRSGQMTNETEGNTATFTRCSKTVNVNNRQHRSRRRPCIDTFSLRQQHRRLGESGYMGWVVGQCLRFV